MIRRFKLKASLVQALGLSLSLFGFSLFASGCSKHSAPKGADHEAHDDQSTSLPAVGTLAEGEPVTLLPVEADDALWGGPTAAVTIVSFLDFECSFCAQGFATLRKLQQTHAPEDLRIVFKHLPLEFHEHAVPAAVVGQVVRLHAGSEAFFRFADLAFAQQSQMSFENLARWAGEAGLDRDTYNKTVSDPSTLERIIQDVNAARRLGIEATPTFFINGRLLGGAQPIEVFEEIIEQELKVMKGPPASWASRYQARVADNTSASLVETLLEQDPHDYRVPIDHSPVEGLATAPVTLVVFSDYECPFCKQAETTVQLVQKRYGEKVRVVFKHLPLPFHQSARPAALLASAVQLRVGDPAFFALSRDLFTKSPELGRSTLIALGRKYGLSERETTLALDGKNEQATSRLQKDRFLADDVVAQGTPHFFINGKRLDGARPFEHFSALIDHELKRAAALVAQGVDASEIYSRLQADARSPGAPQRVSTPVPVEGRPSRGPTNAPVVIHVFSDFECPYCRLAEQNLRALNQEFAGQLRVVWHDFPLPFHERALPLARAAHAAHLQGNDAFWKMHEAIFALDQDQARITDEQLEPEATKLHLNWSTLSAAMKSDAKDGEILRDQQLAASVGIRGTPAFIIGDYLVTGAKPASDLARVVRMVLDDRAAKTP